VEEPKPILLPLFRLQNKAVRTLGPLNMTKLKPLYSKHKILNTPVLIDYQLPNLCSLSIMVIYLIILIATFLRLHQSTNIKQGLLLCAVAYLGFPAPGGKLSFGAPTQPVHGSIQ